MTDRSTSTLRALGERVASEQDRALASGADADAIARAQARLRADPRVRPPRTRSMALRSAILVAASLAAVMLVVTLLFFRAARPPAPLAFQVDDARGEVGRFLEASPTHPLDVRFTDASLVTLDPSSQARVTEVTEAGARISLERGGAQISVTHREGSRWHIQAGPMDVLVTGTRFHVAWDPTRGHFLLSMDQGTVRISGGPLASPRTVSTGEKLELDTVGADDPAHAGAPHAPLDLPAATDAPGSLEPSTLPLPPPHDGPTSSGGVTPSAPPSEVTSASRSAPSVVPAWIALARRGAYAPAYESASRDGLDRAYARAAASDLVALGDAARFSGHPEDARAAYLAARARSPGSAAAAEAAFDLGRLAFDHAHDYAAAARWFATYRTEAPRGALLCEADGREIEALQRAGDADGARVAARAYLARWPAGPHADLARKLVGP